MFIFVYPLVELLNRQDNGFLKIIVLVRGVFGIKNVHMILSKNMRYASYNQKSHKF